MVKDFSTRIFDRVSGKLHCIICGRKANLYESNYAMLDIIKTGGYAFLSRIEAPTIPGVANDFLCEECINNSPQFKIKCTAHGVIQKTYQEGLPPVCRECADEARQILNFELPPGYWFILQANSAVTGQGEKIQNPIFALSKNFEVFLFSKKEIFSAHTKNLNYNIFHSDELLTFIFDTPYGHNIKNCSIYINQEKIPKSCGPWIIFWEDEIRTKLKMELPDTAKSLASLQFYEVPKNSFNQVARSPIICLFAIENGKILTFPEMNIPCIEEISAWKLNLHPSRSIELAYNTKGVPGKIVIKNIPGLFENEVTEYLTKYLPSSLKNDFSIDKKGLFDLFFPWRNEEQRCLLEREARNISTMPTNNKSKIVFSQYQVVGEKMMLIPADYKESALLYPSNIASENIISTLPEMNDLFLANSCSTGIYFDSRNEKGIYILNLFQDGFTINETPFQYSDMLSVTLKKIKSGLFEVLLNVNHNGNNESFAFIASEGYAYNTKKALEICKLQGSSSSLSEADLYQSYNELKKYNLLTGIFSDTILLNRELNNEVSMQELAQQVEKISANKLFEDKKLYEKVQKKILMLCILLPKIKQNFEYLASYYPYYHLKNEIELIAGAFGNNVAQKMLPGERKRIIASSRSNVRNVQSKIQTIINEIERAVYPIEQLLSKEELRSTLSAKALKYFPHGGQALLIGTLIATTGGLGGVSVVAGMLGIRTMNDILNYFRNDRETAAQIKKAFEKAYPWWQLLEDTMPLAVFETAETIAEDNNYSVQRDNQIFKQFPKEKQPEVAGNMRIVLNKKIQEGTESKFLEILEGSGIRFDSLISDIEMIIDEKLSDNIESITKSFALPHLKAHEEKKNG